MISTLTSIANTIGPFAICAFILYVCCGWILVFFKRTSLVLKYFTDNWEEQLTLTILLGIALLLLVFQFTVEVKPGEVTPLGFMMYAAGIMALISFFWFIIVGGLKKLRDKIPSE